MPRIIRRPRADTDVAEIWDYIADDSFAQADVFVDRLDRQFGLLAKEPFIGRARSELGTGLRSLPFGRYVIFYRPIDDGIEVVRVLHSARDVDAQFGDTTAGEQPL